jgi:DNA-binding MarR family transcriptional regulator
VRHDQKQYILSRNPFHEDVLATKRTIKSKVRSPAAGDIPPPPSTGLDLDILDDIVGYRLRRAQVVVYQDYVRTVGSMDIRPAQFAALTIICSNPGLSQTTLAATMGIDRSGAVILIDALEGKGLASRVPSPTDRRTYAIMLTEAGHKTLTRLKELVAEHDQRVTSALSPEERVQLNDLLLRLYQE